MTTSWRTIGLLFLAGLFAAAQFAKIAVSLDELAAQYPPELVPWAVSALSIAGILLGVVAGAIVAHFGARRVLLSALLAAAAASFLQALLPPFGIFMALRVLEGLSHLAIVVAAPTLMIASASTKDVPVAMGIWGTFFGVGFAGTAAVAQLVPSAGLLYVTHGVFGLLLFAGLAFDVPKRAPNPIGLSGVFARHVSIYTSARLAAPALGFFWHTLLFLGLLTFLPDFIGAWSAPLLPLIALVGTFGAGWVARYIAPRTLLLAGFGLTLALSAILLVIPGEPLVLIVFALLIVIGLVPGASFANVPALNNGEGDQALANGAIAQLGNVGTACSVPLMAVVSSFGVAGLLSALIAISLLGLLNVWLIHRNLAISP